MAIVVAALAAGCGDDGDRASSGTESYVVEASTTMATASITKARFIRHMNRTCRQAWVTILSNFNKYRNSHPELSRKERFAEAVRIPLLAGITFLIFDDIRFLGAPPGDAREIEQIIGPMQAAVELGQRRRPVFHSVAQLSEHFEEYNRRAGRYGLEDCLVDESHLREIES